MSSESMELSTQELGDRLFIAIVGRLDTASAPSFDAQLAPLLSHPRRHIFVDLSAASFISSAGLRSILQLVKHTAAQDGRVGLIGVPPHILEVVEISGFPALLDLFPDRQSALGHGTV